MIDWERVHRKLQALARWAGATAEEAEDAVQRAFLNMLGRDIQAERPYAYLKRAVLTETWRGYHRRVTAESIHDMYWLYNRHPSVEQEVEARLELAALDPADVETVIQYTESGPHTKAEHGRILRLRERMRRPPRMCECGNYIRGRRADAIHCSERCARRLQKRRKLARQRG